MIGILINSKEIDLYSKFFLKMFQYIVDFNEKSILLFTIENLNLKNRTINGNLITIDNINETSTSMPKIIYNFCYKNNKNYKKRIRLLAEDENTILINKSNEFNQKMIFEILTSNENTKDFIFNKSMFSNIFPIKKWSIIDKSPNLFKCYKDTITVYMQKNIEGKWIPILRMNDLTKKIIESSIIIANYISNFISQLGFCIITFIMDKEYNPYLINFNGFNTEPLALINNHQMQNKFINNIFNYADYLNINQEEVTSFVD